MYKLLGKRLIDIILAIILGAATLPIMILAALIVKLTSKGPVIFTQQRLGLEEREFEIYKFRTMYQETPSLPPYQLQNPNAFITPVGRFLRKSSIDELPQILNVLKGDMSFVGPRPGAARNEEELRNERRKHGVFQVRPGITGLAQVYGRDVLAMNPARKALADKDYVENISFRTDIHCLLQTVRTVITRDGYNEGTEISGSHRKKVLFLIHTLGGGGAEKVLIDLAKNLDREKFDVTIKTVLDTGIYRDKIPEWVQYKTMFGFPRKLNFSGESGALEGGSSNLSLLIRIYSLWWQFAPVRVLRMVFFREKYDVEVAFLEGISTKIIAKAPLATKKIAWIHTDFSSNHRSRSFFLSPRQEFRTYAAFEEIVCVSDQVRTGFERVVGCAERLRALPNFLDTKSVKAKGNRDNPFNNSDSLNVVAVGRLLPVKGYDRLVRVCNELHSNGYRFNLHLVGEGAERPKLQKLAGSSKFVHFHGYKKNPYPYIKHADLVIIPSLAEGFSTVMVEAMALETPVASTKVSGSAFLPEKLVIENNENALRDFLSQVVGKPRHYEEIAKLSQIAAVDLEAQNQDRLRMVQEILFAESKNNKFSNN